MDEKTSTGAPATTQALDHKEITASVATVIDNQIKNTPADLRINDADASYTVTGMTPDGWLEVRDLDGGAINRLPVTEARFQALFTELCLNYPR
jgi:hypothetical protein